MKRNHHFNFKLPSIPPDLQKRGIRMLNAGITRIRLIQLLAVLAVPFDALHNISKPIGIQQIYLVVDIRASQRLVRTVLYIMTIIFC